MIGDKLNEILTFLPGCSRGIVADRMGNYFFMYPVGPVTRIGVTTGRRVLKSVTVDDQTERLASRFREFAADRGATIVFDRFIPPAVSGPLKTGRTTFVWKRTGGNVPELMGSIITL